MTRTQAAWLTLTAVLLVAWAASGTLPWPIDSHKGTVTPRPAADPIPADALGVRAASLRQYLASARPPAAVRRNPFVFSASPPPAGMTLPATPLSARHAPRPEMKLSGIAEDVGEHGPVRTAVISAMGQVFFAKEGDRVLSRFFVVRVVADAVQLRDTDGDELFTLVLR